MHEIRRTVGLLVWRMDWCYVRVMRDLDMRIDHPDGECPEHEEDGGWGPAARLASKSLAHASRKFCGLLVRPPSPDRGLIRFHELHRIRTGEFAKKRLADAAKTARGVGQPDIGDLTGMRGYSAHRNSSDQGGLGVCVRAETNRVRSRVEVPTLRRRPKCRVAV